MTIEEFHASNAAFFTKMMVVNSYTLYLGYVDRTEEIFKLFVTNEREMHRHCAAEKTSLQNKETTEKHQGQK